MINKYLLTSILVSLITLEGLSILGCSASSLASRSTALQRPTPQPATPKTVDKADQWVVTNLSIDLGTTILPTADNLFVIGSGQIARIQDKAVSSIPVAKNGVDTFYSLDGGISILRSRKQAASNKPNFCSPDNAIFQNNKIYAIASCEHTGQLQIFPMNPVQGKALTLIDYTFATFPNADSTDPVYGPIGISTTGDGKIILPATLKSGPALLELSENPLGFHVIWTYPEPSVRILSLEMDGKEGMMLLNNGKILRLSDAGKRWKPYSIVPDNLVGRTFAVRRRNKFEAFLLGEAGILLQTTDDGKSWQKVQLPTNGSIYKIVFDQDRIAVLVDFKDVLISRSEGTWSRCDLRDVKRVDDIDFFKHRLVILSAESLYQEIHSN